LNLTIEAEEKLVALIGSAPDKLLQDRRSGSERRSARRGDLSRHRNPRFAKTNLTGMASLFGTAEAPAQVAIVNFSETGLCVKGQSSFSTGDLVKVTFSPNADVVAKVTWIQKSGQHTVAGLEIIPKNGSLEGSKFLSDLLSSGLMI